MHNLRHQGHQDGSLDVFIYIQDTVCKTEEKIVHKTRGKTEYFSHKVGHIMFFYIHAFLDL